MPDGEALSGLPEDVNASLSASLTLHQPWKDLQLPGPRKLYHVGQRIQHLGFPVAREKGVERDLCISFYADTMKHLD